ncbi:MAG: sugar phosphate isomerase/epimerase family protein [Planctomycetia bacterium]
MRVAIVDYLLRASQEATFYMARELGFDGLEITVDLIGDPNHLLFNPRPIRTLRELSAATKVGLPSVHATHFVREALLDPSAALRSAALADLEKLTAAAARQGIPTVVVPLVGASSCETESPALVEVLEHAAKLGEKHKVRFAFKSMLAPLPLASLIDGHPSQQLGVCFDPANILAMQRDPLEELKLLGTRVVHVHLKDRMPNGASCALGKGTLKVGTVLQALVDAGYGQSVVLDTPSGRAASESATRNLKFVRQSLAA